MSLAASKKRTVWERDGACHYCGDQDPVERTVDHVWPQVLGGAHANWNLVAACHRCNGSLGHRTDKCSCGFCVSAKARHATKPATYMPSIAPLAEVAGWSLVDGQWRSMSGASA